MSIFVSYLYNLYADKVKYAVVDKSVVKNQNKDEKVNVVSAHKIKSTGELAQGRSHAFKAVDIDDGITWYHKKSFCRKDFINELIAGCLGKALLPDKFPMVKAVETTLADLENTSEYTLISESLDEKTGNINLEQWAREYTSGNNDLIPQGFGLALAFDMLLGKTDSKLANLVVRKQSSQCYSIDNETAWREPPTFITTAKLALEFVGEFKPKTYEDKTAELDSNFAIDTQSDNIHQPLKGEKEIKNKIAPLLEQSIENDSAEIIKFYEKFANFSEKEMQAVFHSFSILIHPEDENKFMADLKSRQEETKAFLKNYQDKNIDEVKVSFGIRK